MKKQLFLTLVVALGVPLIMTLVPICEAAQPENPDGFVAPAVFQAAGPTASSIQSTVDAFRAALGEPNNADNLSQPIRAPRDQLGPRRPWHLPAWSRTRRSLSNPPYYHSPGYAVQPLPEHPRRAVHHAGRRAFPGASSERTARRPCGPFPKFDLRPYLQHLQPVPVVHSSGQQHH